MTSSMITWATAAENPVPTTVAVVPVLVNTGAAVLPAVLAAAASFVAILLKPRELLRVCRARPWLPLVVIGGLVGLYFAGSWLMTAPPTQPTAGRTRPGVATAAAGTSQTDWTRVAIELIRLEARQQAGLLNSDANTSPNTQPGDVRGDGQASIYRGDAQRTGLAGGPSPSSLTLLAEYHAEPFAMVLSSPLVVGDRVYAASTLLDPPATYGTVFALDAKTGDELWKVQSLDAAGDQPIKGVFSSPGVTADGRYVIIGQGLHDDSECDLLCFDAATGSLIWKVRSPLHIESSPAIAGDIVVVGAGAIETPVTRKPQGDPEGRGHPGYVFAVRISTGEELWRYQINDPESSPVIHDGVVYIGSGFNGNELVALRLDGTDAQLKADGKDRLIWRVPTPYPAIGAVTWTGEALLVGCGNSDFVFTDPNPAGAVIALDPATGEQLWRVNTPDSVLGSIAVRDGMAYVAVRSAPVDGLRAGMVLALDLAAKGKEVWRTTLERSAMALAGPAVSDSHVYVTSSDGYLLVLDAADGSIEHQQYINQVGRPGELGMTIASPFVAMGRVYVGSETGGLRIYVGSDQP